MGWDFSTEPEFQEKLDWIAGFVHDEVEPLDLAFSSHLVYDKTHPVHEKAVRPLQDEVKARDLWACHLGPELGGKGYGQLKLGLMNEILGRSNWAPSVFGSQAPDSGNAEIIAHYGTEEQKEKYLQPLLDGRISSCYSMTEPQAGPGPQQVRWRGESEGEGAHAYVRYENVRVPTDNLLGGEGQAFVIAQTRLGGGRIHHAMRTIGQAQKAIDMMCERALSRQTQGSLLAEKQFVQGYIADSYAQLVQFRLFVLYTAWEIDRYNDYKRVRKDIAATKVIMPTVLHDIAWRAMQVHGALGVSNEMPFFRMIMGAGVMGLADGPTEVHKVTVARQLLRDYRASDDLWPTEWIPRKLDAARARFAEYLEHEVGNL